MKKLLNKLRQSNLSLASAESLTGGLFGAKLTQIAGCSYVYKGGFIVYSNYAKSLLLDIDAEEIEKFGAISSQSAILLAKKASLKLKSDIGISFTGNAGPSASDGKNVGLVYIGISYPQDGRRVQTYQEFKFTGNRQSIRLQTIREGQKMLLEIIEKEKLWQKK